jgi:hypothetical protein
MDQGDGELARSYRIRRPELDGRVDLDVDARYYRDGAADLSPCLVVEPKDCFGQTRRSQGIGLAGIDLDRAQERRRLEWLAIR